MSTTRTPIFLIARLKYSFILLFMLSGMIMFQACKKDLPVKLAPEGSLIEQAKAFFELQNLTAKSKNQSPSVSKNNIWSRQNLAKKVLWDKAHLKKISTGEAVIVPLSYNKTVYTKVGKGKRAVTLDYISYLMIYKTANGSLTTEMVTWIPDDKFWDNRHVKNTPFTGKIIVENWEGKFIKGYLYLDNGNVKPIVLKESVKKGVTTSIISIECETTDWYSCASSDGGQNFTCGYDYSETSCYFVDDGGGSPSGDGTGGGDGDTGGGSSGGGTNPGDYPPPGDNENCGGTSSYSGALGNSTSSVNPCAEEPTAIIDFSCASFRFTTIGAYQHAGVSGIKINIVDTRGYARIVPMPPLVFGLPTFLINGQAATFAASAVNLASDEIYIL